MKKLSIKELNKLIESNNAAFKAASKKEKRILIAKDVLAQIKLEKYNVVQGEFLEFENKGFQRDDSLQELFLRNKIETCNLCALGGIFMSCTNLNNKTKLEESGSFEDQDDTRVYEISFDLGNMIEADHKFANGLTNIFSKDQLELIELAFEEGNGYFHADYDEYDEEYNDPTKLTAKQQAEIRAVQFGQKYDDDKKRLEAIMKNIIKNDGEFKP